MQFHATVVLSIFLLSAAIDGCTKQIASQPQAREPEIADPRAWANKQWLCAHQDYAESVEDADMERPIWQTIPRVVFWTWCA